MFMHATEEPIEIKELGIPSLTYSGPLKSAIDIAQFYGFYLIEPIKISKNEKALFAKDRKKHKEVKNSRLERYDDMGISPEEKASLANWYASQDVPHYHQPLCIAHIRTNKQKKESYLKLEVLGSNKTLAEAFSLHVAKTILADAHGKKVCIKLNSLGEDDSEKIFREELINYLREHINILDPDCRQALSSDPYEVFHRRCQSNECAHVKENAPSAIGHLSEHARRHFMDIIEHLETMGSLYEIDHSIFGHGFYKTREAFEIHEYDDEGGCVDLLAKGERYDGVAKLLGHKKSIPSVTISIKFKNSPKRETYKVQKKQAPLMYFIQLGPLAKKRSLYALEALRSTGIQISHSIFKDDMKSQKELSIFHNSPYVAIFGQKEAAEGTMIIRNVENRSQDTVPLSNLGIYIKRNVKA